MGIANSATDEFWAIPIELTQNNLLNRQLAILAVGKNVTHRASKS